MRGAPPETARHPLERRGTGRPELFRLLRAWQREVRAGVRGQRADDPTTWINDELYQAAGWERAAEACIAQGQFDAADRMFARAQDCIAPRRATPGGAA